MARKSPPRGPDETLNASESPGNFRGHGCNIGEHVSAVRNENETFLRHLRPFKAYTRKRGHLAIVLGLD